MPRPLHPLRRHQAHPMTGAPVVAAAPAVQVGTQGALVVPVIPAAAIAAMTKQQILGATPMQNIVTLGEINDALKIAAVSAAQLADMGFAALANKPICEGLPPEESRRLRNAKLYPAESIGQIRVALAQRFAEPTTAADVPASGATALSEYLKTCEQHQIVPDVGGAFASAFAAGFNLASSQAAQREATAAIKTLQNLGYTYNDAELWKPPIGKVPDFDLVDSLRNRISELEASQAAPAAVAVPDDRAAFERELIDNHHYVPSDFSFKDGFYGGDDDYIQFGWDVWQARAALDATPAAVPVVLPEPDAVISELMGLVDEWGMESHLRGEAELDAQHSEATQEEIDCAKDRASKERAAWKAIESKLRALLAAGGEAQAAPAFYAALGSNGCALPQYSAGTEEGVILNVLSVARNEGYTGSGLDRLIELGWVVRPVYTRPTPATADSLATATGLPAQAVPLKLIEAINTACGGNEWQGEALAPYLLEAACRAITSLAPQAQAVPAFCHVASLKLKSLQERGYQITGYALEKPVEGAQPERGFINHGGFVGWWWDGQSPQAQADARDAVLVHLDGLLDDAAAHIYPSDLNKFQTGEHTATVASVRMGNSSERSVPLYSREQVVEAFNATQAAQGEKHEG